MSFLAANDRLARFGFRLAEGAVLGFLSQFGGRAELEAGEFGARADAEHVVAGADDGQGFPVAGIALVREPGQAGAQLRPVGFRMHGYEPIDVAVEGLSGPITYVGDVKLRPLPEQRKTKVSGKVILDGNPDASAAKVSLSIASDPVNTPSNGVSPRPCGLWAEPFRGALRQTQTIPGGAKWKATQDTYGWDLEAHSGHVYLLNQGAWKQWVLFTFQVRGGEKLPEAATDRKRPQEAAIEEPGRTFKPPVSPQAPVPPGPCVVGKLDPADIAAILELVRSTPENVDRRILRSHLVTGVVLLASVMTGTSRPAEPAGPPKPRCLVIQGSNRPDQHEQLVKSLRQQAMEVVVRQSKTGKGLGRQACRSSRANAA